ncbi:cytochrome-c peroxidase [Bradyrhizobium sp. ERR14]|uniref:cytochrome-c peroxidase n=1 Tax=Bradyrhizobium sp. ERR14 TaxID=2663837 RepID=UPI00183C01AB|nr:cytochrome c peroxidase [Bradyrhizobium sp. ERR14]
MEDYVGKFKQAFPRDTPPVTFDYFAKALKTFEATLTTPAAPFDQYLNGHGNALDDHQKVGLRLFMDKGCGSCHNGINIGGQEFFPFGVIERPDIKLLPAADQGRFAVTKAPATDTCSASPLCATLPCELPTSTRVRFGRSRKP